MSRHTRSGQAQAGFTIIELLIAMVIFAVVLLVIAAGVLQFTKQYYKGVNSSNTQGAARAIIDDITRAVQFNKGSITRIPSASGGLLGYCVGDSKRYSFALGAQVVAGIPGTSQSRHALVADQVIPCTANSRLDVLATLRNTDTLTAGTSGVGQSPQELLGNRMRLAAFDISENPGGSIVKVVVRVAYGDDDLLCNPSVSPATAAGGCASGAPPLTNFAIPNLTCRGGIGTQFCAVSELSTSVNRRVQ